MARPPRSQRPRVNKPSPLQQEISGTPISNVEASPVDLGVVRDPLFWKRFSVAMHDVEKGDIEMASRGSRSNSGSSGGTLGPKYGDEWLQQQKKESRGYCIKGAVCFIALIVALILGLSLGFYYRNKNKSDK
ncbi:hypothetical protein BJ875DRAFT_480465 [Amylocarpus encephaloides]|uniref:Uncharacterized protein n=1 Tax=Amylocarpus encephaloides TaxID=45428 RepID=A0A9P7YRE7_9HELO|nr:hypothetical protein BJ875DRAFT_480465 [Amylocarpus encephaloides]